MLAQENNLSPIEVELARPDFATVTNKNHPANWIGYGFYEHTPMLWGGVPLSNENAGLDTGESRRLFVYR